MATIDDVERMARMAGLAVAPEDLERLAPVLTALYADLDRLIVLPIADLEPAFMPRLGGAVPDEDPPPTR